MGMSRIAGKLLAEIRRASEKITPEGASTAAERQGGITDITRRCVYGGRETRGHHRHQQKESKGEKERLQKEGRRTQCLTSTMGPQPQVYQPPPPAPPRRSHPHRSRPARRREYTMPARVRGAGGEPGPVRMVSASAATRGAMCLGYGLFAAFKATWAGV
jgi:hypothetical protein